MTSLPHRPRNLFDGDVRARIAKQEEWTPVDQANWEHLMDLFALNGYQVYLAGDPDEPAATDEVRVVKPDPPWAHARKPVNRSSPASGSPVLVAVALLAYELGLTKPTEHR